MQKPEKPSYINLFESGELKRRERLAWARMKSCTLCPHHCGVDRTQNDADGFCRTGRYAVVHSYAPHHGEEYPLSGSNGSGTIFFTHCNMGCVFCQNWEISSGGEGVKVAPDEIASVMLSLQARGCHNVNLVTPSHIVPQFLSALLIAVEKGLSIPIVYNSGGYDSVSTLKFLDDVVDIYMPDMKYGNAETAHRLSKVNDYVSVNQASVLEMHRQVGDLQTDRDGIGIRGLIVRHLVMPGMADETEKVLRFLAEEISVNTCLNLMSQYRPQFNADKYPPLNRALSRDEYFDAMKIAERYGLYRLEK